LKEIPIFTKQLLF